MPHEGPEVTAGDLDLDEGPTAATAQVPDGADDLRLDAAERTALAGALEAASGNQRHAASLLGVSRNTVRALTVRHGARLEVRMRFERPG